MEVPQGFEKHYPYIVVLKLLKTIYWLKQAAMVFGEYYYDAGKIWECSAVPLIRVFIMIGQILDWLLSFLELMTT